MSKKQPKPLLHISLTKVLDQKIEDAVNHGEYATKADLIRDAVRKLLETK